LDVRTSKRGEPVVVVWRLKPYGSLTGGGGAISSSALQSLQNLIVPVNDARFYVRL